MLRKILCALAVLASMTGLRARAADAIPIALRDGLVWTRVTAAGVPLHFVVDTGAETSCLDLAVARRLHVVFGAAVNIAGVDGRVTGYRCGNFMATAGPFSLASNPIALDLSGPSMACSQRIDGLIGADFFKGRVVRLDYARHLLSLASPLGSRAGVPLRFAGGVICLPVSVDGAPPRWTRLDTGCTDALVWCAGDRCRRVNGRKSIALAATAENSTFADLKIGATRIPAVPAKFRAQEIFPGEAGLLGNATLRDYSLTIDAIRNRLLLDRPAE